MNGLLTALLGGASGVGQGLQYQDEKAGKIRQLDMAQHAQDMEAAKLKADLFMQGIQPDDGTPVQPSAPPPVPQAPPPAPQGALTRLLPQWSQQGSPSQMGAPGPSVARPTQPGGMSGADAIRSAAGGSPIVDRITSTDGQSINLPGMGRFKYNFDQSPFARQIALEQMKRRTETDEKIRESSATGATAKNVREANTPRLGDADYATQMGEVARAESGARLPSEISKMVAEGKISRENGLALEQVRAGVQAQLQLNQHQFEIGKLSAEQKFAADQKATAMAGEFFNTLGVKQFEQSGQVMPSVVRGVKSVFGGGSGMPATAPSAQVAPAPGRASETGMPTAQQTAWDNAAAALRMQRKDPAATIGPRP